MKRLAEHDTLQPTRRYPSKRRRHFSSLMITVIVMLAMPVLAEAPPDLPILVPQPGSELISPEQVAAEQLATRQKNRRRLILLNECIGCDLVGVTLTETHLIGADLRRADLRGVDLTGSNLEGADLAEADLTGANLSGTFLTNTSLMATRLDGVNFSDAHLYSVDVSGASMNNLNLTGAQLFDTPIYVGGEEGSLPDELEPMVPAEDVNVEEANPDAF